MQPSSYPHALWVSGLLFPIRVRAPLRGKDRWPGTDGQSCLPAMPCSMSKDFGANGLRIGVLVSQHNPELMGSFMASAILMKVASPAVSRVGCCPLPTHETGRSSR